MWGTLHITSDSDADAQIGPNDIHKFQKVVLIGIATGLVASIIFHVFVKEGSGDNSYGSKTDIILTFEHNSMYIIYDL